MLTYAEVKALATGNALLLEQAEAAAAVARLRLLQSINRQSVTSARRRLADAEQDQYRLRQQTLLLAAARETVGADGGRHGSRRRTVRLAARALRERLLLPAGPTTRRRYARPGGAWASS